MARQWASPSVTMEKIICQIRGILRQSESDCHGNPELTPFVKKKENV
ncbi:MAG: hypothetical protein AAB518_01835 [Patescibacteria group bacterium]